MNQFQVCGGYPDTMTRCAQLLSETCDLDFIDINCGCPIDLIYNKVAVVFSCFEFHCIEE